MPTNEELKLIADTIRTLTMDAVQKANSGHPGMPMGCADIAAVLWGKIIRHNPEDPGWKNRDRFVLSAGHGSMLLYSALHLSGYDITLDDIKSFRQWESKTPGHPEHVMTPGVETTTGPLGQGFANGVGMAIAADMLAKEFNTEDASLIDHYIYGIVSDGDLMEGISAEAASLAGHLGLGRLIYLYDCNGISIEGSTDLAYSDDVRKRFEACHWHVQEIDGHNYDEIEKAILAARDVKDRPSIIISHTRIAKGSPNLEGCEDSHGAPLGPDEIRAAKKQLGCDENAQFDVPSKVYDILAKRKNELKKEYRSWRELFDNKVTGEVKSRWEKFFTAPKADELRGAISPFDPEKAVATRSASGKILEALFKAAPNLIGGSADLAPSNKTFVKGYGETGKSRLGRNIHFGIREHAMGAVQNGIAYYGGLIPYGATFLVFMDYMRPAVRIAALGHLHTIYVFTHDSFFVGEDGPTHQPVEHLAAARAIPNLTVIRPADAEETAEAWIAAMTRTGGPTALCLTRQNLPIIKRDSAGGAGELSKGAYIVRETKDPDIVVLASGSEVQLSIEAAEILLVKGIRARVVSFPSWELFDEQTDDHKKTILPEGVPMAVVEAGIAMGWERYAGKGALFITKEGFGTSAPDKVLADRFGFTKQKVADTIQKFLKG